MPKESFMVYLDFEKTLRQFTPEEALEMVWAFFEYNRTGVDPKFSSRLLEVCWVQFKTQFDRDAERYRNVCNRNRQNGMNGGRPKSNVFSENPNNPLGFEKPKQTQQTQKTRYDNDNDNDLKKSIINNTPKSVFGFDEFWDSYGKKVERSKCEKLYAKISEADREKIKAHVPKYVAATPEIQYRKNPQTYLNGKCWNDEIIQQQFGNTGNTFGYDRNTRATYPGDEERGKEFTNGF